jgi:hypothetical protein
MKTEHAQTTLNQLHEAGLHISISETGGLSVGPAGRLTNELRAIIKANKTALLALMEEPQTIATKRPPGLSPALLAASLELDRQQAAMFHKAQAP